MTWWILFAVPAPLAALAMAVIEWVIDSVGTFATNVLI